MMLGHSGGERVCPGMRGAQDWRALTIMCAGDNLQRYGWLTHNGVDFGEHEIADRSMNLQLIASMVKFNASSSEVRRRDSGALMWSERRSIRLLLHAW